MVRIKPTNLVRHYYFDCSGQVNLSSGGRAREERRVKADGDLHGPRASPSAHCLHRGSKRWA
jgi:hypothetical protein